jgi:hypothetical protein
LNFTSTTVQAGLRSEFPQLSTNGPPGGNSFCLFGRSSKAAAIHHGLLLFRASAEIHPKLSLENRSQITEIEQSDYVTQT